MTKVLSYKAEMLRRVLAMMIGLPIESDTALREDTSCLVLLDGTFEALGWYRQVLPEITSEVLNGNCHPSPTECVETLRFVLDETHDPIKLLHLLAAKNAYYFLKDGDRTIGLFDDKGLVFFEDFLGTLSVRRKLRVARECVELAERSPDTRIDFLHFARKVLEDIKYEQYCPADHRRNLVVGGLDLLADVEGRGVLPSTRNVSAKDVLFGIDELLGRLLFPESFRTWLEELRKRKPDDDRSDVQILREGIALLEAIERGDTVILPKEPSAKE